MSASIKTFVDGSTPQCGDDDLNGYSAENNNLILGSGQALNTADNQQTHKAVAVYAAGGDFYTDSGSATAYVLGAVGAKVAPPVYFDGMRVRFIANTTNTGAATINVAGLGAVSLYLDGAVVSGGGIQAGELIEAVYLTTLTGFTVVSPRIYGGYVDSLAVAEKVPAGWNAARFSAGDYTVTHNLGLATSNDLAITLSLRIAPFGYSIRMGSIGPTGFGVKTYNASDVLTDWDFFFVATPTT